MRFDFLSFLIGFVSAAVVAFILYRLRARLAAMRQAVDEQVGSTRQFLTNTAEGRYYNFLVRSLNRYHIGGEIANLVDLYIEPHFLQAPMPVDPTAEKIKTVFHVVPQIHDFPAAYAPYNLETLNINDLRAGERHLALLGPPGAGKSTALAVLGLIAAGEIEIPVIDTSTDEFFEAEIRNLPDDEREKAIRHRQEIQRRALDQLARLQKRDAEEETGQIAADFSALLPILVHLRDIDLRPEAFGVQAVAPEDGTGKKSAKVVRRELDPAEPLVAALQRLAGGVTASMLPRLVYDRLTAGTALVLIDGYEDIPAGQRPEKLAWLQRFITIYRANFIVVTGPLSSYDPLVSLGLSPVFLRAWSDADYEMLVNRWAAAWLAIATARRRKKDVALPDERVIRRVATNNRGRSPLDVTLKIWAAFADDEQQPGRLGWYDFYVRHHLDDPAHRPVLAQFAGAILDNGGAPLTRERMKALAAAALAGAEGKPAANVDELLNRLMAHSELLVEWPDGRFGFNHALVNACLAAEVLDQDKALAVALNPNWDLALAFAAAHLPMDGAITLRLDSAPDLLHTNLFSVIPWLVDAPVSAPWRGEVFKRLTTALIGPSQFPHIRDRAMAALVTTHDKGVLFILRQALKSTLPQVRRLGCIGLGALGDSEAIKDLAGMLADPDTDVQLAAGLALAAIGTDTALETMVNGLYEGEQSLRRAVAEALAAIPGVGHATLREAIADQDMMMRHAAVFGLARVKASWSLALLYRTLLEDEQWYVRNAAEEAFTQMERPDRGGVRHHPEADALNWLIAWAAERGEGVPAGLNSRQVLIRVLQEGDPVTRAAAARTLANLGHVPALKPLYSALRDSEEEVRAVVYEALAALQIRLGEPLPAVG